MANNVSYCEVCGAEIPRGKRYKAGKYKSHIFCGEECFERFCALKTAPKPPINFKPEPKTDRRKFTDLIQDWTGDMVNWSATMKQAKDIQEQYELDWADMFKIAYYARHYEGVVWDFKYGLGQIFPKYIEPAAEFEEELEKNRQIDLPQDIFREIKVTKERKRAKWRER